MAEVLYCAFQNYSQTILSLFSSLKHVFLAGFNLKKKSVPTSLVRQNMFSQLVI